MELAVAAVDVTLPATLTVPAGAVRGGLVVLHGANCGRRDYYLYEHIARIMAERGVAVLRYDRREWGGHDVPFGVQAADALAAVSLLRKHIGSVPIGLFGYSQGGWVATLAAAEHPDDVAFVVSLASPGVSPGEQMRFYLANELRANGYGDEVPMLSATQDALYAYFRGQADQAVTLEALAAAHARPWIGLTGWPPPEPSDVPAGEIWPDLDYDPAPSFEKLTCPVLTVFGDDDQVTPVDETLRIWRAASARAGRAAPDVVVLEGCGHAPNVGGGRDVDSISPRFTAAVAGWVGARVG